ncbi:hypothetical protein ACFFGH_33915 [Lysobacter korlensis]|uniref:Uncharacterized protein n=1 Tax=Lysobacter korlensis TaxID=553636 RepID=A0ABV6S0U2_9GAMM
MSLLATAKEFLAAVTSGDLPDTTVGKSLALSLRTRPIELQYSKATEFSPEIQELALAAAQVALVSHGPSSPELAEYEKDVFYYRYSAPPHPIVSRDEAFKSRWAAQSGGA